MLRSSFSENWILLSWNPLLVLRREFTIIAAFAFCIARILMIELKNSKNFTKIETVKLQTVE